MQFVCTVCGFNMIENLPDNCPFCGASKENFITAERCSQKYSIKESIVKESVTRLNSYPHLGLEHSAYCIKIGDNNIWIDCPSTFSKDLEPMDKILFTHHHFLGASNLYRSYYTTFIWIHEKDSKHPLSIGFPFDRKFAKDFNLSKIEAFHIGGHTPGFTFYVFEDILFICDYFILKKHETTLNPYGPAGSTLQGAKNLIFLIKNRNISTVCGFNYVLDYDKWSERILKLLLQF